MKHLGDITKINGAEVPAVDIIVGGSPCQDLSVAGLRAGLAGARSGLFMDQVRIIKEMRENDRIKNGRTDEYIRPRYMVWENVPGAFSSNKGEDFRAVLEETAKIADENAIIPRPTNGKWTYAGCIMGDGWSIAWRVHDAQFWGVPQRRKRIALVADFAGGAAPEILFERKGVSGDITESGKEREETAGDVRPGIEETGRAVVYGISAYESNAMKSCNPHSGVYVAETARTLDLNGGSPACNQGGMAVVQSAGVDTYNQKMDEEIAQPLRAADGGDSTPKVITVETHAVFDARGNGNGGLSPTITGDHQNRITDYTAICVEPSSWDGGQVAPTLTANNANGSQRMPDKDNFNAVIQSINGDIAGTLDASYYKGCGERQGVEREVVAYGLDRAAYNQGMNAQYDFAVDEEKIGTQVAKGPGAVCNNYVVRRLTPMECERLQGFPDHWTDIGDWVDSKGKKHKGDSDSPRYKALGNSIALPFWQWMAGRMVKYIDHEPTMASLFDGIGGFPLVFSRCGCKPIWASEIEEFPIAVTKVRFPDD